MNDDTKGTDGESVGSNDLLGWHSASPLGTALLWDWRDNTGAVDNLVVRLDAKHPQHDGGPEERMAWYDVPARQFVCASSATVLPNVIGWRAAT